MLNRHNKNTSILVYQATPITNPQQPISKSKDLTTFILTNKYDYDLCSISLLLEV